MVATAQSPTRCKAGACLSITDATEAKPLPIKSTYTWIGGNKGLVPSLLNEEWLSVGFPWQPSSGVHPIRFIMKRQITVVFRRPWNRTCEPITSRPGN